MTSVKFDQDMGDLTGLFQVVEGCNGIYVYHVSGHCQGAGDGSDSDDPVGDLVEYAKFDPTDFAMAYGPRGDVECPACEQDFDVDDGSLANGQFLCPECKGHYDDGYDHGYGAGDNCELEDDAPEPADASEYEERLLSAAYEGESYAREFSPWEFTAKAINDRELELWGEIYGTLWELYDAGVNDGITAAIAPRVQDWQEDHETQE